jgi:hypothetical protein
MIVRLGLHDYSIVRLTQEQRLQLARGGHCYRCCIVCIRAREKFCNGFSLLFTEPNRRRSCPRMRAVWVAQVLCPSLEAARLRALNVRGNAGDAASIGAMAGLATAPKNVAYVRRHKCFDAVAGGGLVAGFRTRLRATSAAEADKQDHNQ